MGRASRSPRSSRRRKNYRRPFAVKKPDVIIIGGGVVGALSAFSLAKAGARVTLLEKESQGPGASRNSAAMLEAQLDAYRGRPFVPLAKASHDLFVPLRDELREVTGIDIELELCGILQAALDEKDRESLKAEMSRHLVEGWSARWLEPAEIALEFPALTHQAFGAILYEDDGQVSGVKFLEAARAAAKSAGAEINVDSGSIRLLLDGGRVVGAEGRSRWKADAVVVAAGAWTDAVLQPLGVKLGIEPVRGQLLWYQTSERMLPCPVYTRNGAYLCPKGSDIVLAGTTTERVGFDGSITEEGRRSIMAIAARLSPDVASKPIVNATAGLRPCSPDGLPFIGPVVGHDNVFVAAGHHRNGVLLAPITAEVIAAMAMRLEPPVNVNAFTPARSLLNAAR
ncbi:MAG: FAD-dependent oxidoreductase [Elusimicrobia bacterium]|nr:FAD-dependent oxidoreductase [Elusimicrobiota bacterium]